MGANAYRIPAERTFVARPHRRRSGQAGAIVVGFFSLGCALFAAGAVVCTSIFSAPDPASIFPVLMSLFASFGAWRLWNRSHARGLSFDAAHAFVTALILASVVVSAGAIAAFTYGTAYPPPPFHFSFGFGAGC
jgi:hypothetical protein